MYNHHTSNMMYVLHMVAYMFTHSVECDLIVHGMCLNIPITVLNIDQCYIEWSGCGAC